MYLECFCVLGFLNIIYVVPMMSLKNCETSYTHIAENKIFMSRECVTIELENHARFELKNVDDI